MESQTTHVNVRLWGAILLLSLGLNAFLIWNDHYQVPDVNFFPHGIRDAYFVKRHSSGEVFVIEHSGRRYTAKCQDTITWLKGIYSPGEPMSDGCTYMSSLVGKSVAEGLMRREGNALVYQPWEQDDTEQTADVLTIISDEEK